MTHQAFEIGTQIFLGPFWLVFILLDRIVPFGIQICFTPTFLVCLSLQENAKCPFMPQYEQASFFICPCLTNMVLDVFSLRTCCSLSLAWIEIEFENPEVSQDFPFHS